MTWIVLGVVLAGPGCVLLPSQHPPEQPRQPPPPAKEASPPPPAVTPDGITEGNARDKVQALREEIARDQGRGGANSDQ
jgi:hypothetical protein